MATPTKHRELDYDDIKSNLSDFLKNQTVLADYDLDQSAAEILISLLAANTHYNAIVANTAISELFLDTATLRKNIISSAKRYGYTPSSALSAKAVVDITFTTTDASPDASEILEKGAVFTAKDEDGATVTFSTISSYTASLVNTNQYIFTDVEIYQGAYGSIDFFIDKNKAAQTYEIQIADIDTNLIEVYVQQSVDLSSFEKYTRADSALTLDATSTVFFLQEGPNGFYEVEFGDDIIGKDVLDGQVVRVVYFKTKGEGGNAIKEFDFSYTPSKASKINQMINGLTTVKKSSGGTAKESNDSIKLNAPKFYVSQNRGVVNSDYEFIIKEKFPYIKSISVWSGKTGNGILDQFGRSYISVNTSKSQFLTTNQKNEILEAVRDEIGVAGIIPVIIDVDNVYIDLTIESFVNDFIYIQSSEIKESILSYASDYSNTNLEQFGGEFKHSRFVDGIDNLDSSIQSNLTSVTLHKRVYPDTTRTTSYEFSFANAIDSCYSNSFTYDSKTVYIKASTSGQLDIYEVVGDTEILVNSNIGTVDFSTGDAAITDLNITQANKITKDVRFYANPVLNNISSDKNVIALIDSADVTVTKK